MFWLASSRVGFAEVEDRVATGVLAGAGLGLGTILVILASGRRPTQRSAWWWTGLSLAWGLLIYGVALWRMPDWMDLGEPRDRHNARLLVSTVGGGAVVLIGLFYTGGNYRLTRRGQVTDRFTKALERLGSDELYVRYGGVLALEQIVQDAPDQATHATQVLVAFIRDRTPASRPAHQGLTVAPRSTLPAELTADVQAALTALTRPAARHHVDHHAAPLQLEDRHLAQAQLGGADLTDARLKRANLTSAQLDGADLTKAQLDRANLTSARLFGAALVYARLNRANLTDALLNGADLTGARLDGANLHRARLKRANLTSAQLDGANLISAQLDEADLTEALIGEADLIDAQLNGANLASVWLAGANLSQAQLRGVDLTGAVFQDADLTGAQLNGANLSRALGFDADLTGAQLNGADLTGARLDGANLHRAQLKRANLTSAQLNGANLTDAWLSGVDLTRAQLNKANLTDALLNDADLTGAQLDGADLSKTHGLEVAQVVAAIPTVDTQLSAELAANPQVVARIAEVEVEKAEGA